MKSIGNKIYEKTSKITDKTHFGKGLKHLKKAQDQKLNPEYAILSYKEAIHNLTIAHEHHPISNEIKETLDQACSELFLCALSLLESSTENIVENKFFTKDLHVSENNLIFDEAHKPANTRKLARMLQQKNVSDKQKEELRTLALGIINRFGEMTTITIELVDELTALSYFTDTEDETFKNLLEDINKNLLEVIISKIKRSTLLHPPLLKGLSHIIRHVNPKSLDPNDLVRILTRLKEQFENSHNQDNQIEMVRTLGLLFDAMADCKVKDLSQEELHNPLYKTLEKLSSNSNLELAYQARYACQALICIPNDESPWKAFQKRANNIFRGFAKLAGAITSIDPGRLPEAFEHLGKGLEGIEKVINGAIVLVQGIQEGTSNIKQGLSLKVRRQKWYWALRYIDLFIQSRQFTALEKFVYKVPCFQENDFLWGLCERLEQLILDPELDTDIHKGAVSLLDYICQNKNENHWKNKHEDIVKLKNLKRHIPTELLNYVQRLQTSIENVRPIQLHDLEKNRGEISAHLDELHNQFLSDISEFNDEVDLYVKLQGTWNVPIIKLVNNKREMTFEAKKDDIEEVVNRFLNPKDKLTSEEEEILKTAATKLWNFKDKMAIINAVNGFFTPENKLTLEDERILEVAMNQFLDLNHRNTLKFLKILTTNECKYDEKTLTNAIENYIDLNRISIEEEDVLLILGGGGTGKSTFNRYLARRLWKEYDQQKTKKPLIPSIPLFIPLALIEKMVNQRKDLIEFYLREECKLTSETINALRERRFVFILDGYDEIANRNGHFYNDYKFNEWKNLKIIISCRPEYLGKEYKKKFSPKNDERKFQELTIAPFSQTEIVQYIRNYVNKNRSLSLDVDTYKSLNWNVDIYIQRIEQMSQEVKELISNPILLKITLKVLPDLIIQINRIVLYEQFLITWFDHAHNRLLRMQETCKEAFDSFNIDENIDDFSEFCLRFSKEFATKMFIDNKVIITYDPYDPNDVTSNWNVFLGSKDKKRCLYRFSMPLIRRGKESWFLHKSLRDHLIALALFESCKSELHNTLFNKQLFVPEHGVRQFLAERIQQNMLEFKPLLLDFIDRSKNDENIQIASANASTILTQIGAPLGKNLNDINISGADLSNGVFNDLKLERAKLNNVNFQNAKLRNANLQNSSLQNANFKDADLQNTLLQNADFQNAKLQQTNLQNANLQRAKLPGTSFRYANFKGANLSDVNLYDMNSSNGLFWIGYCYDP
ncbi:NACHT domain-containing protein [Gigaspora margarita]|uniref:NACHT domain-containing protein n=1 Tax=Gigaspora margarita TaxID=4874 RepID=A0A8H4ANI7_GIGMA|nr:NACHT domain-containing protein [Gigaspora margarita]